MKQLSMVDTTNTLNIENQMVVGDYYGPHVRSSNISRIEAFDEVEGYDAKQCHDWVEFSDMLSTLEVADPKLHQQVMSFWKIECAEAIIENRDGA